jgi:hypothetical protein
LRFRGVGSDAGTAIARESFKEYEQ